MAFTRLDPACIACLIGKHLYAAPKDAPQETQVAYMQRMLRLLADADPAQGAPVLVSAITALRGEMFGEKEDFTQEKLRFNALMLGMEAEIAARIGAAQDPLRAAVQYAMIGNYIDFGAMDSVDEGTLAAMMEDSPRFIPQQAALDALRADLSCAKRLVYLTDNCGEVVMDKLFLALVRRLWPQIEATVIVRGAPVLNDATLEDAQQVGLDRVAHVMGNGSAIAGTCLPDISAQARAQIEAADVIIAKGQANFETLRHCGLNVYYIFLCKCQLFAERFDVPRLQGMLLRDAEA